ncbi:MAG TPA: sulfatase [Myxococcota bacterium]|nr:sulfatase [Myxococcota bacterium]
MDPQPSRVDARAPQAGRPSARERSRRAVRRLAAGLALATAAGCGGEAPPAPPPNLVLISIDSLRADRLGCYGAERDTSPAIDALCARGVRFEQAVAPTSWTLPSHVTLLTGQPIPVHRVVHPETRIDPERTLLAEHLRAQGYRTAGFVSAPFLHRSYGFSRGFDRWENFGAGGEPPSDEAHAMSHHDETAPQVVGAALGWLAERPVGDPQPWFLFVHLWDVHYDFIPPAPYDRMFDPDYAGDLSPLGFQGNPAINPDMPARDLEHLRALYDGEIRWLDSQLAPLLATLGVREGYERVVIGLVADHGEEFFEHGQKGHYKNLFDTTVHVPFILVDAGRLAPRTVPGLVGLEDVAPTLLGLAGLPPLAEALGRDLSAPLLAGASLEAESTPQLLTLRQQRGLRGDGWKVIEDVASGYAVYYDLAADPDEQDPKPARSAAPDRLEELEAAEAAAERHADGLRWSDGEGAALSPDLEERLRELGYLD